MAVYVDAAAHAYGRMIMCHMVADSPEELRAMAESIGVASRWFQRRASAPHFDVCRSKRALALRRGAIDADRRTFVEALQRIRANWPRDERGHWTL